MTLTTREEILDYFGLNWHETPFLRFEMRQVHQDPGVEPLQLQLDPLVLERVVAVVGHPLGPAVQVLEPEIRTNGVLSKANTTLELQPSLSLLGHRKQLKKSTAIVKLEMV